MPWGVAAAVGGALITGSMSADASQSAADTQANAATQSSQIQAAAADRANATQKEMQQKAIDFQSQQTKPYTDAGKTSLQQYQHLLNGGATNFDVSKMPGYDFQMKQAKEATNNSASAGVGALSGNAQIALQDRAQGLATAQYGSYMDRLAGLVSLGENAGVNTGNAGAGIIQGVGNTIARNQMALGPAIGGNINDAGNAQAAAQIGSSNAWGSALNSITSNSAVQKSLSSLFGTDSSPYYSGGAAGSTWTSGYDL